MSDFRLWGTDAGCPQISSTCRGRDAAHVCSGNRDLDSCGAAGEKVARWLADTGALNITRDGNSIVDDDTLFTVCPWWDGPVVRAALVAQLGADARRRHGRRWIGIHHAPPRNSPTSWSGSKSMGGADLEQWIGQHNPDIVVACHIHQSPFVKDGSWADRIGATWVFNPGGQYGVPPAFIALETTVGEAVWISAMDLQTVRLEAPLQRPIPSANAVPGYGVLLDIDVLKDTAQIFGHQRLRGWYRPLPRPYRPWLCQEVQAKPSRLSSDRSKISPKRQFSRLAKL